MTENQLLDILNYGRQAPSVHNAQPWNFELIESGVVVKINPGRKLVAGDPIGRQTWISIGACVETIVRAGASFGYKTLKVEQVGNQVKITFGLKRSEKEDWLPLIKSRFTDRSKYLNTPIPSNLTSQLKRSSNSNDIQVMVSTEPAVIAAAADLTSRGIGMALQNPEFRNELSSLISTPLRKQSIGISSESLLASGINRLMEPYIVKYGLATAKQAQRELELWSSSPGLVLILSRGDNEQYWFEAGRAYLRSVLIISKAGLHHATSAAIVEAMDFHEDIEKLVDTKLRLQALVRFGFSNAKPKSSPRLSVKELLV